MARDSEVAVENIFLSTIYREYPSECCECLVNCFLSNSINLYTILGVRVLSHTTAPIHLATGTIEDL